MRLIKSTFNKLKSAPINFAFVLKSEVLAKQRRQLHAGYGEVSSAGKTIALAPKTLLNGKLCALAERSGL